MPITHIQEFLIAFSFPRGLSGRVGLGKRRAPLCIPGRGESRAVLVAIEPVCDEREVEVLKVDEIFGHRNDGLVGVFWTLARWRLGVLQSGIRVRLRQDM